MSSEEEDILRSRENLQNALGAKFMDYMQSMRKWLSGKISKQEFDNEAREIATQNYVHLHNDFLLCIISKCNNFSSNATEAATKTIFPSIKSSQQSKTKRKLKTDAKNTKSNSYHLRFVPVDPVKHAPSLLTSSIESTVAAMNQEDFSLEFCARERCLPYTRMIHGRMLLTAFDYNLKNVDMKAVFLLAEATVWMLKNLVSKLVDRSKFKHNLRLEYEFEKYKDAYITDKNMEPDNNLLKDFEFDADLLKDLLSVDAAEHPPPSLSSPPYHHQQMDWNDGLQLDMTEVDDDLEERKHLNQLADPRQNPAIVSTRKLPITLYDLKNMLQLRNKSTKSMMPSHSVYTINMERLIMNLWHPDNDDIENNDLPT